MKAKAVQDWLMYGCTKSELAGILAEANLTPRQRKVMDMKFYCDRLCNYQIAMALDVSVSTVDRELRRCYDAVLLVKKKMNNV